MRLSSAPGVPPQVQRWHGEEPRDNGCVRLGLLLVCLGAMAALPAADPPAWSGVISVEESINTVTVKGGDEHELEHFAIELTERLHQARSQVLVAPPFIARVIREDMGFYEAELEKVAAERGGRMLVGRTTYFIKGPRMLILSDGARMVIDRASGTATGVVDGQPVAAGLQHLPDLEPLPGIAGDTIAGYPTRHTSLRVKDRTYLVDVAPGLPNPYRIGLMANDLADDLVRGLAEYDGLPMRVVENDDNAASRELTVAGVDRRDINDGIFAP